jgi:N-acetyl-alpha-D-muramate 1-phosphate uridylyltransferase
MSLPVAILAGGTATRLRPLTESIPKALVDVAGKPFVEYQLELLKRHGFTRIVFCVGYLGEKVRAALGNGDRWGMELSYVFDGEVLLGTGGALRKALPLLGEQFLVLYGDTYLDCDYAAVEAAFLNGGKLGLMTVFRNNNRWDQSNVFFVNGRIMRYDKRRRGPEMRHIDYGLGALQAEVFEDYPDGSVIDLAQIYQDLLARDELAGFEVTQRFYEIGTPGGLDETRRYLKERTP